MSSLTIRRYANKASALLLLSAAFLLPSFDSSARTDEPVQGSLEQHRIVRAADGKETRLVAEKVKPGETLEYTVRYTNKGIAPVNQFVVTLPIPRGLELIPQSDQPRAALASTDGVTFEPMPLKRRVKRADGNETTEPVPLAQYRALRWQVDQLGAGKSVVFAARAIVESTTVAAAR